MEQISTLEKRKDDRRRNNIDFSRRKFNKRGKEFVFPLTVYLSDTNAVGNVYFAQYFIWQGKVREDWFKWVIGDDFEIFMKTYKMITVEAHHKYKYECLAFDEVEIGFQVEFTKMCVLTTFNFRFKNTKKLIGIGHQKIAFKSFVTDKLVPVPNILVENATKLGA